MVDLRGLRIVLCVSILLFVQSHAAWISSQQQIEHRAEEHRFLESDCGDRGADEDQTAFLQGRVTSSMANNANKSSNRSHTSEAEISFGSIKEGANVMRAPKQGSHPQVNPEDAGIAGVAKALLHFSTVTWILLCCAMLLWLTWNIYQIVLQATAANVCEDETMFQNLGFAVTWASLGIGVIFFNKCLYMKSGDGFGFPRPILLNWFHMFSTAAFTHLVRFIRPDAMPAITSLSATTCFCNVVPIASLQTISLCLGNMAYLYISVSYIQMVKNTTSAFVFLCSISMGLEEKSFCKAIGVTIVISGMMLTSTGDQYFNLLGFALQLSGTVAEAFRLCLTKALLSTKYSANLDPLSACCVSSTSVCFILTFPMLLVDAPHVTFVEIWDLRLVLCANALLVVCLNLTSMRFMKKVGPTTYALTGVLKDVVLVLTLLAVFGSGIANLEGLGFAVSLVGLYLYNSNGFSCFISQKTSS